MSPAELLRLAAQADSDGMALIRKGDPHGASERFYEAQSLREAAAALEARLTTGSHSGNLREMLPAARVRQSKGAAKGRKRDDLAVVASEAGHTIRSLAEALGCSHVFLLKARSGAKAIRYSWAQKVQAMTRSEKHPDGFQATGANWPAGWAREE